MLTYTNSHANPLHLIDWIRLNDNVCHMAMKIRLFGRCKGTREGSCLVCFTHHFTTLRSLKIWKTITRQEAFCFCDHKNSNEKGDPISYGLIILHLSCTARDVIVAAYPIFNVNSLRVPVIWNQWVTTTAACKICGLPGGSFCYNRIVKSWWKKCKNTLLFSKQNLMISFRRHLGMVLTKESGRLYNSIENNHDSMLLNKVVLY